MRRTVALASATVGALFVHACVAPHYGIDPALDEPSVGDDGGTSSTPGGAPGHTGGVADGGTGNVVPTEVEEGSACDEEGALACVGVAQQDRFACREGTWKATDPCGDASNCEQSSGDCMPIVEACAGGVGGKRFCQGLELVECGPDLVTSQVIDTCRDRCLAVGETAECVPETCGDKTREEPEQCDDGNDSDTDDCTNACKVARCGDTSVWEGHETCDDGNVKTEVCAYGMKTCPVCNASCQKVVAKGTYCGDGLLQEGHEACDPEWEPTANKCQQDCVSTTWALWPVSTLHQPQANYGYLTDIVVDHTTDLTWQRTAEDTLRTWEEAKTYCRALSLSASSDWRLPTKIELMSLVDYTVASPGPMVSTTLLQGALTGTFWTSSEVVGNDNAYHVSFSNGFVGQFQKTVTTKVRCVHSG